MGGKGKDAFYCEGTTHGNEESPKTGTGFVVFR